MTKDIPPFTLSQSRDLYQSIFLASRNFAERSRREYATDLRDLIDFLERQAHLQRPDQVSRNHLESYLAELDRRGLTGATRRRKGECHRLSALPYSPPTSPYYRLVVGFRTQFFEEAANSELRITTTTGWQFDRREEDDSIRGFIQPFLDRGEKVYLVELVASLETRLGRNVTENRRSLKRVDWSTEEYLRRDAELHPYRSDSVLPFDVPHLRLETDQLSAEAAAERIREHFGLANVGSAWKRKSGPGMAQPAAKASCR